jgi:hypothetical protein
MPRHIALKMYIFNVISKYNIDNIDVTSVSIIIFVTILILANIGYFGFDNTFDNLEKIILYPLALVDAFISSLTSFSTDLILLKLMLLIIARFFMGPFLLPMAIMSDVTLMFYETSCDLLSLRNFHHICEAHYKSAYHHLGFPFVQLLLMQIFIGIKPIG